VLILGGLFYKPPAAAPPEPTPNPIALSQPSPVLPSATTAPTDTPAATVSPTETLLPPTETPSPVPLKTLGENCIATQTWKVNSTDTETLQAISDKDNCWNLNQLGFSVSGGALRIVVPSSDAKSSGIYTEIGDQAVIKFNVSVQDLHLGYPDNPAYITFSIAPQDNPMTKNGSGRFKLQVNDLMTNAFVYFVPADSGEANGTKLSTQHYLYGHGYDVRLELDGPSMNIYINDSRRPVETVSIPIGPKVFYIGYDMPLSAAVTATIKDVSIDGVNK